MANNIRSTNLCLNLEKDLQRKEWEYLQVMDKQEFKSYSHVIALALVDYFYRYYRTQEDPYLFRERARQKSWEQERRYHQSRKSQKKNRDFEL